jgi:hypothetical protein
MAIVSYVTPPCVSCREVSTVEVEERQLKEYLAGSLIHAAFPDLTADERELIMSGIHPTCWDQIMQDHPEES